MVGQFKKTVGSRAEVFHGTAEKTQYGKTKRKGGQSLEKKDLVKNKDGRIVSRELHMKGSKLLKRLNDAGYFAKKGKFGSEYKPNKDKKGKSGKSKTKKRGNTHKKRTKKSHKKRKYGTKKRKYKSVVIRERRSRKTGRFMGGKK
jgi:hypothetical protein